MTAEIQALKAEKSFHSITLQGLAEALEEMVACACLYYHSHSLDEFSKPIKLARAALAAAKPFLEVK